MRFARAIVPILSCIAMAAPAQPPAISRPQYRPSCPACRVEMVPVVRLGGAATVLITATTPARDSRGRYFAAVMAEPKVAVFDSTGRFLRTIGGRGEGPGELGYAGIIRLLVGTGDTLYVVRAPNVVEVFTPSLTYARRFRFPAAAFGSLHLTRDGFVASASAPTPEMGGEPFHTFSRIGEVITSFGGDGQPFVLGQTPPIRPRSFIAMAPDGNSFWTTGDTLLNLQQWSTKGQKLTEINFVGVPWIKPIEYFDTIGGRDRRTRVRRARPYAQVYPVRVDAEGLIWLNSYVPNPDASKGHPTRFAIEVVDPALKTVLVSHPYGTEYKPISGNLSFTASEDADGIVTLQVWRAVLRRR